MKRSLARFILFLGLATLFPNDGAILEAAPNPILVVVNPASSNPFHGNAAEILLAEGYNAFQVEKLNAVTLDDLKKYDIVILTETKVDNPQKIMFQDYVKAGGGLLAFRPDLSQFSSLFGVHPAGSIISDRYIKIDTEVTPGQGLEAIPLKFHGDADQYPLNELFGATRIAALYGSDLKDTGFSAVVKNCYGAGHTVAFAYDLCKSLVYTRQGNPAWAGQDRDGDQWPGVRAADMFYDHGNSWNDKSKADIPQADEQMRLMTHALEWLSSFKKPLPRLWYFPDQKSAMTVFTGDSDFAGSATIDDEYDTVNGFAGAHQSIYLVEKNMPSPAEVNKWIAAGNEVAVHFDNTANKTDPTWALTNQVYDNQLRAFKELYPNLDPVTVRNHWLLWCGKDRNGNPDFTAQAEIEMNHGIKLDCNYYMFEPAYQGDAGYFTGSALPMKFVKMDGTVLDIYHSETQIPDETWKKEIVAKYKLMVDRSLNQGKYAWINVNFHPSMWLKDPGYKAYAQLILQHSVASGVPVCSAKEMYDFTRAKTAAKINDLDCSNNQLSFSVQSETDYGQLTVMLPNQYMGRKLTGITRGGTEVSYLVRSIKGTDFALMLSPAGRSDFVATYSAPARTTDGNNGRPWPIPGRIQAENFDLGVPGDPAYFDTTKGSEAPEDEFYRVSDADIGVDFVLPLADVGWTEGSEWLEYTVDVKQTGMYQLTTLIATPQDGKYFGCIKFDGADIIGRVDIPNTGGWGSDLVGGHKFEKVVTRHVALTAGVHKMHVEMGSGLFTVDWFEFQLESPTQP